MMVVKLLKPDDPLMLRRKPRRLRQQTVKVAGKAFEPSMSTGPAREQIASILTRESALSYCFLDSDWGEGPHKPVKTESVLTEFALSWKTAVIEVQDQYLGVRPKTVCRYELA